MIAHGALLLLVLVGEDPSRLPLPVGPDAVWAPPSGFLEAVRAACAGRGDAFGECFVGEMRRSGASEAALAFARQTGSNGYLRRFRDSGRVDVAWAELPFRANENSVCYLVNGLPPSIDVDDLSLLGRAALERNPDWATLAKTYPNLAIFPSDRFGEGAVEAAPRPGGGQRFLVGYALVDGCHACARVGVLRLGFDFDGEGKYLGLSVVSVTPQPR